MAIFINDNHSVQAPKPNDARYGPWTTTTAANSGISIATRYQGLTVGVYETGNPGDKVIEYWYRDGVADVNLVIKTIESTGTSGTGTSGTSGTSGATGT